MAGLTRKTSIQFGNAGPTSAFGQFGSKEAGTPQTSQDPAVIQGLPARWQQGWQAAVVSGDKAAYIEDMNGFCFVDSYQLTYLFQMGIPEWDSATLYFDGSVVETAVNGQWFKSLQGGVAGIGAGQSGNAPPVSASNAFWLWVNPPENLVGVQTLNTIPMVTSLSPSNGVPGCVVLGDSHLADNGSNIVIKAGSGYGLTFQDGTTQTTAPVPSNAVTVQSPPAGFVGPPTRAIGTTYQNTGTKPRFVSVSTLVTSGGSSIVFCDSTATPSVQVCQLGVSGANVAGTLFFIVLPNYYYKVSGGSLDNWTEWT